MRKQSYDVVVIGCGPCGAVAGRFAAQGGAKTLIIEKKRTVGIPDHDWAGVFYSWSDAEEMVGIKINPAMIINELEEIAYFSPMGRRGKGLRPPDAKWVDRNMVDELLAVDAVAAGAELMVDARVSDIVREGGRVKGVSVNDGRNTIQIDCKVVIGASGGSNFIPAKVGLQAPQPEGVGMAYELIGFKSLKPGPSTYECYTGTRHGGTFGHGGLIGQPTKDRLVVGAGTAFGIGKRPRRLKDSLIDLLGALEDMGLYDFSKASTVAMRAGTGVRNWGRPTHHKIVSNGVMLAGDAAGQPLVGSKWGSPGIFTGMFTGRVAGQAAAAAIKDGNVSEDRFVRDYSEVIHDTSRAEVPKILEAQKCVEQLARLNPEKLDKAVADLGEQFGAMRLYVRGALSLSWCLEPVQEWLRKEAN